MSETIIEVEALPLILDDVIVQGATWRRKYFYLPGNAAPAEFDTWTARLQIRPKFADQHADAPTLELTTENGGIVLLADGSITLLATATQTQSLVKGGKYDLELYQPAGDTIRFLKGGIILDKEVTR